MKAEVISIGDELTSGQRLDTNSQWLSQQLGDMGIGVLFHTTVGDDLAANIQVFQIASQRADIVLCTGGLGPTADDLTREAMAQAFNRPLVQDNDALAHIKRLFSLRKRAMPERNIVQAQFAEGSKVVHNPHGSAPGIDLTVKDGGRESRLIALPGVPAEMKEMFEATVRPAIAEITGEQRIIRHHRLKCFGIGESDLEAKLPDLIRRGRTPSVGITVSKATITLRITAEGPDDQTCRTQMEPTIETIHECLGDLVFGEEDDELQHAVERMLDNSQRTVAICEWGTKGLVSQWLSSLESPTFRGAWTVAHQDSDQFDGRDGTLVESMANQVREQFDSDFGLSIGPVPQSSSSEKPGVIWFGISHRDDRPRSVSTPYAGHPDILQSRAAKQALNFLRLSMLRNS